MARRHGRLAPAPNVPASTGLIPDATKPGVASDDSQSDAETESTTGSDLGVSEMERGAWSDVSECCSSDEEDGTVGMDLTTIAAGCSCPPGLCRCPETPAWHPEAPKAAGGTSQSDAETES